MQHKKKVTEDSGTLSKGVLFLLLLSMGSTLFFSTYLISKKRRLKELHEKKSLVQKIYEQTQQDQKKGMLALFMANELNGWKTASPTIFDHIKAFLNMSSDLKLDFYSSDCSFAYRVLPKEDQNEFFKRAFMLIQTVSAGVVDSGTNKGKYVFPLFLDQMNANLKNPFKIESSDHEGEEEYIPFEGWAISTAEKKEWAWKSVLETSNSDL